MIFGKYINKYYLKNAPILILGLAALILVDYFQLFIPELYRMVINGMNGDPVLVNGQAAVFDMEFLLDQVCRPMIITIIVMVVGRFLWRVCFFGSAIRVVTDLRTCMFAHSKELSQEYYQVNKVGNLMSLYTNDLDTVQECFGDGILMFCDALFLGLLAVIKMWRMNHFLTGLSMIPMAFLMAAGTTLGKYLMKKWEERQAAFSELSDFAQENYSGLAVIKAFVKETKELMMFRRLNRENEDINVEYTKISTLLNIMVTLFVESVICVILGYGGYLVYCGSFDAGRLVEYIGYFSAVVWPIMAVSMLIEKTSRGKASLNRITELLDAKVDVKDRGGVQDLPSIHGKIEFRNLTFRYPDGERSRGGVRLMIGRLNRAKTVAKGDLAMTPVGEFDRENNDYWFLGKETAASVFTDFGYTDDCFIVATYLFDENLVAFTPENSDAPALLLARRSAGGGWDTYKILVNAEGRWLIYREENSSWRPIAKGRTEVDLQGTVNDAGDTDLGFGARLCIGWELLGGKPAPGEELRAHLRHHYKETVKEGPVFALVEEAEGENSDYPGEWLRITLK